MRLFFLIAQPSPGYTSTFPFNASPFTPNCKQKLCRLCGRYFMRWENYDPVSQFRWLQKGGRPGWWGEFSGESFPRCRLIRARTEFQLFSIPLACLFCVYSFPSPGPTFSRPCSLRSPSSARKLFEILGENEANNRFFPRDYLTRVRWERSQRLRRRENRRLG